MNTIAVYMFFVSSLSGYRASKYWPVEIKSIEWLGNSWWVWSTAILGTLLFLVDKSWTIGTLVSFCTYLTISCCIVFFANCNRLIRSLVLVLFHATCILGLIFRF